MLMDFKQVSSSSNDDNKVNLNFDEANKMYKSSLSIKTLNRMSKKDHINLINIFKTNNKLKNEK